MTICKGVIIIAILHLNDEAGWKLKKIKIRTKIIPKGCSTAFNHYFELRYYKALQYVVADKFSPKVVLPDTYTFTATKTGQLPL